MTQNTFAGRDAEPLGPGADLWAPEGARPDEAPASTTRPEDTAQETDGELPRRKRRGSRGGRRRRRKAAADDALPAPDAEGAVLTYEEGELAEPEAAPREADSPPRKTRRSRKRRAAREATEEPGDAEPAPEDGIPDEGEREPDLSSATERRRRRRGKRGGRRHKPGGAAPEEGALDIEAIPGEDDDLGELEAAPVSVASEGARPEGKKGRRRKKKAGRAAAADDGAAPAPEPKRTGILLVNAKHTDEVRVAAVEDGRIVDLQMTVARYSSYVNDIYRGRVVNLESAIGAAFVDFGQGKNGFLHASDVLSAYGEPDWKLDKLLTTQIDTEEWGGAETPEDEGDAEAEDAEDGQKARKAGRRSARKAQQRGGSGRPRRPRLPIEKLLQKGQMCVVQITKDAIGDKGPTLTTYISIPGRYLVLMPSLARTGVSRKIEDEKERKRLKRILQSLEIPPGMGVIVRTAGVGKTKADIKRDLDYLLLAWDDFSRRLVSGRNPAPLYQESDASVRTMRDLFGSTTDKVVVDDEEVYQRMVAFTEKLMPENVDRIVLHEGPKPIFHAYGVEPDFERIFQRRVELPSGGSIVIDQTEALVAIDVNSGRTRDQGADFEDIALKTNLEAAPEIARQIRLRDMGGIIVVDFIDMMRTSNRRQVERAFRIALDQDRARSKVGRISQFGLLELTRQRLGPGLSKLIYDACPRCRGTGRRRSAASRAHAVLRRLGAALTMKGFSAVEVRAHPDTVQLLESAHAQDLEHLRQESGREIIVQEVMDQVEDSVLRYLRVDGREVRPGGRRKR